MAVSTQQVTGTVVAANDKGIRLDGAETWINWSKFADGRTVVGRGDQVVCSVDAAGFLRSVSVVDGVDGQAVPAQRAAAPSAAAAPAQRDVAIIRQTAIKAAAQLYAGSGDVAAVLLAARRFEQFVLGGQVDPESDLPF